ncbi:MAG: VOC family protein [Myxococcaceae bacterium]
MRITSAAVYLPVSDWSKVLPWYRDVLGCRVVHVDESIGQVVHLRFGRNQGFALWLDWGSPEVPRAPRDVRQPGLVLCVSSLSETRRWLRKVGAEPSRTPTGLMQVRDPEGNEIVFMKQMGGDARRAQRRAEALITAR